MPVFAFPRRVEKRICLFYTPNAACSPADGVRRQRLFRFGRRQIVLAGNHLSTRLAFKFEPGALGDLAAGLCGPFVGGQAHRRHGLRDLTRGKLGQGREDELRLSDLLVGVSYA